MITVLADQAQLPASARVWGRENRVLPAREREALCWLTLARLLGWEADAIYRLENPRLPAGTRCVVIARSPESVSADEVAALAQALAREELLVVSTAPPADAPLAALATAAGRRESVEGPLRWRGPGEPREWEAWPTVAVSEPATAPQALWATLGERPLVTARRVDRGVVATLAAHPVELIDAAPCGSGLLKRLMTQGVPGAPSFLDLEGMVVARMDDPGSASSAHLDGWAHRSLGEDEWRAIATDLAERDARITVGYVPGWVDDGEAARGELRVGGEPAERVPGRVHPSPLVTYDSATAPQDNPAGLRGIEALRSAGVGEVELHGYTHVRPVYGEGDGPYAAWASAPDRHDGVAWYRELEDLAEPPAGEAGPVVSGLGLLAEHTGVRPAALCCPGHACSPRAAEDAAEAGLTLIAAESLAIRHGERLAWCDHVRNPYADGATGPWLESGLPVVACLHDRDLIQNGTGWLAERLDEWRAHGARRITDLRELAGLLR